MRYSAAVLDRMREPRCAGALAAGPDVGTGEAGSLDAGVLIRVQVRVADGRIAEARFKAFGCGAAIASASLVAERLHGVTPAAAEGLTPAAVIDALALPAERAHVAGLAVAAARAAMDDWVGRDAQRKGPAEAGPHASFRTWGPASAGPRVDDDD